MRKFIALSLILWILEGFCITMATDLALGQPHDFSVHSAPRPTFLLNFVEIGRLEAEIQRYLH